MGSWMWRKMIKMRGVARSFHKKDLGNGRNTSFWFDHWSEKGVLITLLGERGIVDMGIKREATVAEAIMRDKRRRSYRSLALREIEAEMETVRRKLRVENEDVNMWRDGSGYRQKFSTHATWMLLRSQKERCSWARSIWFSKATPKYAFVSWLAARNRLSTMDRIVQWDPGADTTCVLCKRDLESRNHLFFECSFSSQLWEQLTKGILAGDYTNVWSSIFEIISDEGMERKKRFCLCYALQIAVHTLWRERKRIKHEEKPTPIAAIIKMVDKSIRNKLSIMRSKKVKGWKSGLQIWFSTRILKKILRLEVLEGLSQI